MLPYSRRLFLKRVAIFVPTLYVCKGGAVALSHLHPDAASWRRRVVTNGGNYTSKSIVCNDWMVKALVGNGLRSKIGRMGTFTGIGVASIQSPLIVDIRPTTLDVNPGTGGSAFLDAAFSEGTGLTGNGTNNVLRSGCKQKDLTDRDDGGVKKWHYGIYVCASNNQSGFAMGTFAGGISFTYLYVSNVGGHSFFTQSSINGQIDVVDSAGTGFYCGAYNGSANQKLFKRGAEIGATTSGSTQIDDLFVSIFDANDNASIIAPSSKTFGGYTMGYGIDDANQSALDYIWQRGMGILGRAV